MESDGEIEENSQVEPATTEDVVSGEFEVNSKGQAGEEETITAQVY